MPSSIQITRFGVTADGYLDDQTAGYTGGYARRLEPAAAAERHRRGGSPAA